jgi:hypothetical protein
VRVILAEGTEKQAVESAFRDTMPPNQDVDVIRIERVQVNMSDHALS